MVDIHCHILPEVDDGAYSMEEALRMARMAADSGVTDLFATPHFQGTQQGLQTLHWIMEQMERLYETLRRKRIGVNLHPGVEVLCLPQTLELAKKRRLPTLGDSDYVLVEFYFDAGEHFMDEALAVLYRSGYRPVIAHPERYEAVQETPEIALRWFERGYVLQVNKGSPLGAFGNGARECARQLLRWGVIHVLASDAHGSQRRTTDLTPAAEWCMTYLGEHYTRILLEENPKRILKGEPMAPTGREHQTV